MRAKQFAEFSFFKQLPLRFFYVVFPAEQVQHTAPRPQAKIFGCFAVAWHAPSVYYFIGGTDPNVYAKAKAEGRVNKLPVDYSPNSAPAIHPTLETGITTFVVSSLA
jgi:hypothetical protein